MQKNHPSKFYLNPISKASLSAKMATEINKDGSFVEPMSFIMVPIIQTTAEEKIVNVVG